MRPLSSFSWSFRNSAILLSYKDKKFRLSVHSVIRSLIEQQSLATLVIIEIHRVSLWCTASTKPIVLFLMRLDKILVMIDWCRWKKICLCTRFESKKIRSYRCDQIQGSLIILNFACHFTKNKCSSKPPAYMFSLSIMNDDKRRWTYEFNGTFGIPVAASQDDCQEFLVIAEVQVRVLLQEFSQFFEAGFADFRCFTQLNTGNFKQLRGFRADVYIVKVRHVHNFSQQIALDDWSIIKCLKSFYSQRAKLKQKLEWSLISDYL